MKTAGKTYQSTFELNKTEWTGMAVILLLTFLLFSEGLRNEILIGWDDGVYLEDPYVQDFSTVSFAQFFRSYYLGMYQPLGVATLSLNFAVHGMDSFGYHLINMILHLINTFLVFILIRKMRPEGYLALFVAMLFAIHPMHVESVSWIATRSNSLYTVFFLLASIHYLNYLDRNKKLKYMVWSGLFFVLALFSKSMAVSFPLLMLVFDYFKRRKIRRNMLIEKLPFFILSFIFGMVAVDAAASFGHIENLADDYNLIHRIFLVSYALFFYIWKAIIPVNLSVIYTYPALSGGWLPVIYYISPAVLVIIVFLVLRSGSLKRSLLSGFLFFVVTVGPVLPFFWSRIFIVAERYTYVPYIGLFFMLGILFERYLESKKMQQLIPRTWGYVIAAGWLLFLAGSTYNRVRDWESSTVLLNDVIQTAVSKRDVAAAYFYRGNLRDQNAEYEAAYNDYSEAIRLHPGYMLAYNNRGIILGTMNRFDLALEDFNKVLQLDPGYAEGWYNRGIAFYQTGRKNDACNDWLKAARLGSKQAAQIRMQYCK